jgi:ADP-heptose:LPS heptosyltransferase
MKKQKVDIILSWRIGDAILSIPVLICLHRLNKKYGSNYDITVIAQPYLEKLFTPVELFKCKSMGWSSKLKSLLFMPDKVFFLETTSRNLGYFSKKSYGLTNPFKKLLKFDVSTPFLDLDRFKTILPKELTDFLAEKYNLSFYSMSLFGVCLELGYSVEQIIETFDFTPEVIDLSGYTNQIQQNIKGDYAVFCMEAAYGKAGDAHRCWGENSYFEIARRCYVDFGIKAVFIGVDTEIKLPDEPYIIDLRKKLDLFELACLLKTSAGYIGNDTGPLHIANLMKKQSVAMYFRERILTDFSTLFAKYNKQVFQPEDAGMVYEEVRKMLVKTVKL